jgi:hypothetical protein
MSSPGQASEKPTSGSLARGEDNFAPGRFATEEHIAHEDEAVPWRESQIRCSQPVFFALFALFRGHFNCGF